MLWCPPSNVGNDLPRHRRTYSQFLGGSLLSHISPWVPCIYPAAVLGSAYSHCWQKTTQKRSTDTGILYGIHCQLSRSFPLLPSPSKHPSKRLSIYPTRRQTDPSRGHPAVCVHRQGPVPRPKPLNPSPGPVCDRIYLVQKAYQVDGEAPPPGNRRRPGSRPVDRDFPPDVIGG
ncbi:hypothetical protein LZ31DRAFT_313164 [Colletotrichum somersetense]|nr:hypothetical protein LZ31DRAFT_313164 [Colletotrichum somersetense]